MPKYITQPLRVATVLSVLASYWCLSVTALFGPWILIVGFALMSIMPHMEWFDRRFASRFRGAMIGVVLVTLPLVALIGLMSSLTHAVLLLVMIIQAHELLREKDERNYQFVYLMGICLVFVSCVKSQEAALGVALVVYGFSTLVGLHYFHVFSEALRRGGNILNETHALTTDVNGPLVINKKVRRQTSIAFMAALSAVTIVITAVMFFVLPRTEAGMLGSSDVLAFSVTGLDQNVDLVSSGTIERDSSPVMQVTFPEEPNGVYNGPLYWRAATYDEYTGTGWEKSGRSFVWENRLNERDFASPAGAVSRSLLTEDRSKAKLVYQVAYVDKLTTEGLPILNYPQRVHSDDARLNWSVNLDLTVQVRNLRSHGLQYRAYSEVFEHSLQSLQEAPDNYTRVLRDSDFRLLTEHNLSPETLALVENVIGTAQTPFEKTTALRNWLSSAEFEYSLVLPDLVTDKPIDAFLMTTKIGHCQLFATSLALALRSQGIPTRVVSGYMGGEWDESTRSYTVTADMAHLWVEVYFSGVGWHTIDPSPLVRTLDNSVIAQIERSVLRSYLRSKMMWYQQIVGFESPFRLDRLAAMPRAFIMWVPSLMGGEIVGADGTRSNQELATWAVRLILLCVVATAAYFLLKRLRFGANSARTPLTRDQARAAKMYTQLVAAIEKHGVRCDRLTAGELVNAVRNHQESLAPPVMKFVDTYNPVRFGLQPLNDERATDMKAQLHYLQSHRNGR